MRKRLFVAGSVATIVGVGAFIAVVAQTVVLDVERVESDATYTEATVVFTRGAYEPFAMPTEGDPVLEAIPVGSFVITDGVETVTPAEVTWDVGSPEQYVFTFDEAVTPNETTIVVPAGEAADSEGALNENDLEGLVTLTAADAAEAAGALAAVELDLKGLGAIPFVGSWFRNEGTTAASDLTVQMEAAAGELVATATAEGPPAPLQAQAVSEARPRPLSDLLPGLPGLDFAGALSQQDVIDLLETLDGVEQASFTGEQLQLTFAPETDAAAPGLTSTQQTATPEGGSVHLPFEVGATTTFDLDLQGSLTMDLPGTGTGVAVDLGLRPHNLAVAVDAARIGILGVDAPDLRVETADLVGTVTSCADCTDPAVGLTAALAGDVALVIPGLSFDGAAAGVTDSFSFTDAPTVTWNLGLWDLSAADPNPAPTTVTNAEEFFTADLHQFANLDTRAVVLGLGWVSSWLSATGELDELATKLPGLGLSIDDVLALSDQVGAEATRLAELVEGDPSVAATTDPTAQQLVDLLCQRGLLPCEQGWEQLDGLAITPDTISYDLEFDVCKVLFVTPDPEGLAPTPTCPLSGDPTGVEVTDGGPQLDLELADDLEGIDVSLRAGTWRGTASATLSVRLALDLRPDDELIAGLELVPEDDYPQPDTPLRHQLRVGELCRTLPLALPGDTTPTAFLLANGLMPGEVTDQLACDRLAFAESGFASVKLTDPTDADETIDHQLTAAEVCDAAALIWDVHPELFRELNSYATDAACAADVKTAVNSTPVDDPGDALAPQLYVAPDFTYREPIDTSRVPIGFRVYLEPIGAEPLVDASLSIAGRDLGADVRLGFLDLDLTGTATAAPTATLTLADPIAVTAKRFDLATLARIADDGDLARALTVGVAGPIDVDLTLANPVAFPTAPAQLRFVENDLGNVLDGTWAATSATSCDGTVSGLCYSLGDWTQLRDLSPAAAVQMVTGVLDQVSGLASADDLNLEVPLLGVSLQDMVEFNRSVGSVAGAVESRDPELLTQFQDAIEAGVSTLGVDLTVEEVAVELVQIGSDTALAVQIPFVYSTSTDYPFTLDLADEDLPFAIEPAEGGARLTAGADIAYRPRVGVLLDGDADTAERFVLDVSSARNPVLSATAGGELSGDVTAGPVGVYLYGTASATPTATLRLSQLGAGNWLTAGEMSTLLTDGSFSTDLLHVGGDLSLDASIDWPFGADPTVDWDATLVQVLAGETGTLTVSPTWDVSGVTLDLETLVRGTTQTARFVGQGLAGSEAMGTSLPLVGDELAKLATAGRDLQTIAVIVEDLWEDAQRESDTFVTDANATLQTEICTALAAVGDCTVTLELRDDAGEISGIETAQRAVLTFDIGKTVNVGVGGAQLLDVPGLDVEITDASFAPQASVGYRLGFVLGLDVSDGFYLEGLDIDGEPTATRLLELFASADLGTSIPDGTTPSVQVGGVPIFDLVALDLRLSGSLRGGTAAGFAVDLPQRLTLRDLVSRRGAFDRVLTPTLSLDSSALITVRSPEAFDGLPTVTFPIHFSWTFDEALRKGLVLPEPFLSIGHPEASEASYVTVDATSLIEGVIRPALLEGAQYNPLAKADPVRDALNTQIPVIDSDVRSALEVALGREPSWQLFTFLLDLEDIARSIRETPGAQPYDIGGYQLLPSADRGYFEATDGQLWDQPEFTALKNVIDRISRLTGSGSFDPGPQTIPAAPGDAPRPGAADLSGAPTRSQGAGKLSQFVSLPALSQPLSLATLVMGGEVAQDISFLEVSPPPISFGYAVRYEQTLFDLDVAFLEANLSVALDGAIGVTLRVGFGYSSRGLTSGNPLYGIYLVDAYDGDRDLPAIALGARISARVDGSFGIDVAGVDVAKARFRGSGYVRLEGGVDLFDESLAISARGRGDGMFHLDEIATVVASHRISAKAPAATSALCIFRPVVQLDAGLRFSGEAKALGVKVWSGSFGDDWVLVDESVTCGYRYKVAQLEERRLILNAGPQYAADRFDGLGDVAESFDVRQAGGKLHVKWTGPNATAYDELSFPLDEVDEIYGDLGVGNDEVVIQASVQVPAVLDGGAGNDILTGGSGDDQIAGGPGRDYLAGGGGDNLLIAGPDGPAGDPTGRTETLGICDGTPGTLAAARSGRSVTTGCTVVVAGTGDDVLEGGPRPVVYRLPGNTFGDNVVDHLGDNAVLDLRDANVGVRGTVAQAGISLTAEGSGTGSVSAFDAASVIRLLGTAGDDRITLTAGRDDLVVDGADGADEITVQATAVSQTVAVTDSGTDGKEDTLLVRGTAGADRYLLRAERSPDAVGPGLAADRGIVAVLDPRSGTDAGPAPGDTDLQDTDTEPVTYTGRADASQLVRYDSSIELLRVDGVAGQNEFGLDDVATETIIDGGRGSGVGQPGSRFQVGQIFGWYADETITDPDGVVADFRSPMLPTEPVTNAVDDIELRTRESIRGWISYGLTHETTINGGVGDDSFTVYSNRDTLNLNGVSGDNVFTLRAFIENGSIVATGGTGDDTFNYDFEYVDNEDVVIDGGEGFNTFVAIGTELQDGFVVRDDGVSVCRIARSTEGLDPRVTRDDVVASLPLQPDDAGIVEGDCGIRTSTENIQRFVLYGLEGNNVFWVRSTADDSETYVIGGAHGSTYLLGDDGDLSGFGGTVDVVGDLLNLSQRAEAALRSVDLDFPPPVLFHGEIAYSPVDAMIPADAVDLDAEHRVVADASSMDSGETGELLAEGSTASDDAFGGRITGLSTVADGTFTVGGGASYPGGIGYRGVDLLRVVLGGGADTFGVEDTHPAYAGNLGPTYPPAEDGTPDPLEELLGDATPSSRDGRTELFAGAGNDTLSIDALSGRTWVELEAGTNELTVGTGVVTGVAEDLEVLGGSGDDTVIVDAADGSAAADAGLRADLDLLRNASDSRGRTDDADEPLVYDVAVLTEVDMPGLLRHDAAVNTLRLLTGDGQDVVNIRGALAGVTELVTAGADDRFFVSDAANYGTADDTPAFLPGTLTDLVGDLDIVAGGGTNLLMVSDLDGENGLTGTMDHDEIALDDLGTITYDATGTFAGGITLWTGGGSDVIDVAGVRRDGDATTLAWEDEEEGGARAITTLNTGDGDDTVTVDIHNGADDAREDGFLVVNLGDGDDTVDGSAATLGFVVFGGPGNDDLTTGSGDDLVFGDEGEVEYGPGTQLGDEEIANVNDGIARAPTRLRSVATAPIDASPDTAAPSGQVNNRIDVGDGDDIAWGGLGNAWIEASGGNNALLGDLAEVWREKSDGPVTVTTRDGFIDHSGRTRVFHYIVDVLGAGGGDDVILGGDDGDAIFAGPGRDVVVGGDAEDIVFGGDGDDIIWSGTGDDRVYGGNGDSFIDLKQPSYIANITRRVHETAWWNRAWDLAPAVDLAPAPDVTNGDDLLYGGRGRDVMQADAGGPGQQVGDRLIDWYGSFNLYLTCEGAYGAGWVQRQAGPGVPEALIALAELDGAYRAADQASSGWRQLALVTQDVAGDNRNPPHPDHPGNNATCS